MQSKRVILSSSIYIFLIAVCIFGITSCSSPTSSSTQISGGSPTETQSSTGVQATSTEGDPTGASEQQSIYAWIMSGEIPRGYKDPPNEKQFISNVEIKRIDSMGAEMIVKLNPVVDESCVQLFKVGWVFEYDIETIREGDTFNVTVFNEPVGGSLAECYTNAKNAMAYGGELTIDLKPSGGSHFLTQDFYKHYHEGDSQYLFVITDHTGLVYPVEPASPALSSTGALLVMDGFHEIGEADAPHGNFSITFALGGAFAYTTTYIYDAFVDPE